MSHLEFLTPFFYVPLPCHPFVLRESPLLSFFLSASRHPAAVGVPDRHGIRAAVHQLHGQLQGRAGLRVVLIPSHPTPRGSTGKFAKLNFCSFFFVVVMVICLSSVWPSAVCTSKYRDPRAQIGGVAARKHLALRAHFLMFWFPDCLSGVVCVCCVLSSILAPRATSCCRAPCCVRAVSVRSHRSLTKNNTLRWNSTQAFRDAC